MNVIQARRILNLEADATIADVKRSFRKLAFKMHPDLNPSPDAAQKFREINEAYVYLTEELKSGRTAGYSFKKEKTEEKTKSASEGAKAYRAQQKTSGSTTFKKKKTQTENQKASERFFQQKEEKVLKDILNDPFARQVFEDIYSQINKNKPFNSANTKASQKNINVSWGNKKQSFDVTKGFGSSIKGWMKGQLDVTQEVFYPASVLSAGRNIRITIEQGLRKKTSKTIDVSLPRDFVIGRPIRLKGLGRKLGPFKGDLYLRIMAK